MHHYIIVVLEIMVALLDSGDQDLVYFCCGVLVNFMLDEDKRPVLKREGGISKYVVYLCVVMNIRYIFVMHKRAAFVCHSVCSC